MTYVYFAIALFVFVLIAQAIEARRKFCMQAYVRRRVGSLEIEIRGDQAQEYIDKLVEAMVEEGAVDG